MAPADVTTFEVIGDYVLMDPSIHSLTRKLSGKFTARLLGPYLIVNQIRDKYSCRKLVDNAVKDYHVTQLRQYQYDEIFWDPRTIIALLRDRGDYKIDKIIAHQGDNTKLKTNFFASNCADFLKIILIHGNLPAVNAIRLNSIII